MLFVAVAKPLMHAKTIAYIMSLPTQFKEKISGRKQLFCSLQSVLQTCKLKTAAEWTNMSICFCLDNAAHKAQVDQIETRFTKRCLLKANN